MALGNVSRLPAATIAVCSKNGNALQTTATVMRIYGSFAAASGDEMSGGLRMRSPSMTTTTTNMAGKGRELMMTRRRKHRDEEIFPEDEEHSSFFAKVWLLLYFTVLLLFINALMSQITKSVLTSLNPSSSTLYEN